jgi:pimeloyl-ACP methyl ester carboxylesterase
MLGFLRAALFAALTSGSAPLDAVPQTRLDADLRCLLGNYALPTGQSVTITGDSGKPRGLQYTLSNGQFGALQADVNGSFAARTLAIHFEPCNIGTLRLTRSDDTEKGIHLRLAERETTFTSDGIKLHGKLVLPANGRAEAAAVWIEGSNNDPSTDDSVWQYELARRGIAVFVYDKRGTGLSAGTLLSDFHARARDTAAAVRQVRRLAPGIRRIGVIGGSQGGWVAPLTATLVHLDFVIPAFAMAESPIAQDRELVELQLHQAGFDGTALEEASELTAITERIVRSNLRDGYAELDAFKIRHADAPWRKVIQPRSYTGLFLRMSTAEIQSTGPAIAQGLSFEYEPRPVIETIKPRQLWLLGGSDQQAPNAATQDILWQIQRKRADIAVVVFPKADHGLIERTKSAQGMTAAYSPQLFDITASWIKDRKLPAAGDFIVMPTAN